MKCAPTKLPAPVRNFLNVATVAIACGLTLALSSCRTTTPPEPQSPTAATKAHDHSSHNHGHDETKAVATPGEKLCPVSGEVIEDPVVVQYQGQDVELCCKGCAKKFLANPSAYLSKS